MNVSEIQNVVDHVKYKNWQIVVITTPSHAYLQVRFDSQDPETGAWGLQLGRKWLLSEYMTESEIVMTALKAVLTAEEHEAREWFVYDGAAIFNPHIDIEALKEACKIQDRRNDVRNDSVSGR